MSDTIEKAKTQKDAVLMHLLEHKSLTSWEAFERYGCTRLSAVIYVLRNRDGYLIESADKEVTTRYGKRVIVSEYILKGKIKDGREEKHRAENKV